MKTPGRPARPDAAGGGRQTPNAGLGDTGLGDGTGKWNMVTIYCNR